MKAMGTKTSVVAGVAMALCTFVAAGPAQAQNETRLKAGVSYCYNSHGLQKLFAAQRMPDGKLLFGMSDWYPGGQNFSVFGEAVRDGKNWKYVDGPDDPKSRERCEVHIAFNAKGDPRVSGPPDPNCDANGGSATGLVQFSFPSRAYRGPITPKTVEVIRENPAEFGMEKWGGC